MRDLYERKIRYLHALVIWLQIRLFLDNKFVRSKKKDITTICTWEELHSMVAVIGTAKALHVSSSIIGINQLE